jgi:hypothetical protein
MIKVKITHPYGNWPLSRQTPNNSGIWGDCQFFINDDIQKCDYWFVIDDLFKEEHISCNSDNTVFIALEFPCIRPTINLQFLKQFGTIFSYSRNLKHNNVIEVISPFPWHIGVNNTNSDTITGNYKIYDDFNSANVINKAKLISVISSNKSYTKGHEQRLRFVNALKEYFGHNIDIYGRGINSFADKWDTICPYKYHIALENSSCINGISEKLYDTFLGEAFPFYYGSPNVEDYFSRHSFIAIDINDINQSLKIIDESISNQLYEKSVEYINESKQLVLNNYNIFAIMNNYCKSQFVSQNTDYSKSLAKLVPEAYFNVSRIDKLKNTIRNIFKN